MNFKSEYKNLNEKIISLSKKPPIKKYYSVLIAYCFITRKVFKQA